MKELTVWGEMVKSQTDMASQQTAEPDLAQNLRPFEHSTGQSSLTRSPSPINITGRGSTCLPRPLGRNKPLETLPSF